MELQLTNTKSFNFLALVKTAFRRIASSSWANLDRKVEWSVPVLIEALKDEQGEIRYLAAKTLESIDSEVEIPVSVLIEALDDNETYVRCFAARTLKRVTSKVNEKIYSDFRFNEVHPQS